MIAPGGERSLVLRLFIGDSWFFGQYVDDK